MKKKSRIHLDIENFNMQTNSCLLNTSKCETETQNSVQTTKARKQHFMFAVKLSKQIYVSLTRSG